jgi:glycerol-3-phosphate acyltransferase PlsY
MRIGEIISALCILGHIFPIYRLIFSNIKSAKGIATFFGSVFFLSTSGGYIAIGVWIGLLALFRISAISGIFSVVAFCTYGYYASELSLFYSLLIPTVIIYAHRQNLRTILKRN